VKKDDIFDVDSEAVYLTLLTNFWNLSPYPQLNIPRKITISNNKSHTHQGHEEHEGNEGHEGQQEQELGMQKHFFAFYYSEFAFCTKWSLFSVSKFILFYAKGDCIIVDVVVVIALPSTGLFIPCAPCAPCAPWAAVITVFYILPGIPTVFVD
jgi:hypothetical protein